MDDRFIARLAHQVNKAYCESIGDNSQVNWENAPDWQKQSAINGVIYHRQNPGESPRAGHDIWLKEKTQSGWTYGPVKNTDKKEHPCCVPYDDLPVSEKAKDYIFKAIVNFLTQQ